MQDLITHPILWWIVAVDIPVISGILMLLRRFRSDTDKALEQLKTDLLAFQLDVTRRYANNDDVREVEKRLIAHLQRIEIKLDRTVLNHLLNRADKRN